MKRQSRIIYDFEIVNHSAATPKPMAKPAKNPFEVMMRAAKKAQTLTRDVRFGKAAKVEGTADRKTVKVVESGP